MSILVILAVLAVLALLHLLPVLFNVANLQMLCTVAVFYVEKNCSNPNTIL